MHYALLLALLAPLPIRAADACSVFLHVRPEYGATITVDVELGLVNGAWWAENLCARRTIRVRDREAYLNEVWLAYLRLKLPAKLSRNLSDLDRANREAVNRGGFLYVTATLTGTIQPLEPHEDRAELVVTAIQNLNSAQQPPPEKLPVISMCELFKDLPSHDRQRVAVRGEISGTFEGTWLVPTEKCTQRLVTKGYLWGFDLSFSGPSGFELPKVDFSASPGPTISGVFVGTVVTPVEYDVECRFGELQGYGFGHLSGSPGVFWVDAVLNPVVGAPIIANREVFVRSPCPAN